MKWFKNRGQAEMSWVSGNLTKIIEVGDGVSAARIGVAGASMGGAEVGGTLEISKANGRDGALEMVSYKSLLADPKGIREVFTCCVRAGGAAV